MEGDCGENSDLSKNAQITHFTQNGITAYRQRSFGGSIMPVHSNIGPNCSGDASGVFCANNWPMWVHDSCPGWVLATSEIYTLRGSESDPLCNGE